MCMHAYICVCMHAWEYEHLGACTCVFICTLMCVHMHACMYIFAKSLHKYWSWHRCPPPPPPPQYWKASYAYEPSSNFWVTVWNTKLFYFHSLKKERMQRSATDALKYHIWPRTPHWEVIKHNKSPHTRERRGQPFPSRWPQDCNKLTTR